MARDFFGETFTYVDAADNNAIKPLNNALVTVYLAGTTTKATLYSSRANPGTVGNPITTASNGYAEFWVDAGEYDILVHDNNVPARTADKTYGFNSSPMAVGGIPSNRVAADGGIPWAGLDAVAQRQAAPIGGIMMWWRPASTVPVPAGWVICDGTALTAANHEFPGISTSINLPDLRNAYPLGANSANADAATATSGSDTAAGGPGIGGTGGSNFRNLAHTHDMGNHTHTITHTHSVPAHYHGKGTLNVSGGSHAHTGNTGGSTQQNLVAQGHFANFSQNRYSNSGYSAVDGLVYADHSHGLSINTNTHTHPSSEFAGLVGATGSGVDGDAAMVTGASSAANSGVPSTNNTSSQLSATQDIRPRYVGLLFIMKVRRN